MTATRTATLHRLQPERVYRFYRGGALIDRLRGEPERDSDYPEDWVGSTTEAHNPGHEREGEGLALLAGDTPLRDAIAADPDHWLGAAHVASFGADPAVLVKLLDSAMRLPVHAHPTREFAREHLGSAFGKTEAWIVLAARDDTGTVHLGLREDVAPATWLGWVRAQDSAAMLAALNELTVRPGDVLYVPGGTPHSIGAGLLICELQEPTDLSVLCEWKGFPLSEDVSHMGLGWPAALDALDLTAHTPVTELPPEAEEYFGLERWSGAGTWQLPGRFAVLIATAGTGTIDGEPARAGDTFVVPATTRALAVTGDLELLACLSPRA